jgi:hypothetical protein
MFLIDLEGSSMPEDNLANVLSVFDTLVEQIKNEISHINSIGAAAFQSGQYAEAQTILRRATELEEFSARVTSLRAEWHARYSEAYPTPIPAEPALAPISMPTRAPTTTSTPADTVTFTSEVFPTLLGKATLDDYLTPSYYYFVPILTALVQFGGSARASDVIRHIEPSIRRFLSSYDRSSHGTSGYSKWEHQVHEARNSLRTHGCIKPVRQQGIWEISDLGRSWLSALPREVDPESLSLPE